MIDINSNPNSRDQALRFRPDTLPPDRSAELRFGAKKGADWDAPNRSSALRSTGLLQCLGLVSVCLALSVLGGCAGYRLGPTNGLEAGARSIQINPFSNQTLEPRLGDAVTTAMRRNLQRDGTYRLATHGPADLVVMGVLTLYSRRELSLVPQDVLTVRDFQIVATAQVTLRDTSTGRTLLDVPVRGYTLVRAGADLTSAERQALPLLADDLARKATALLVDGSW